MGYKNYVLPNKYDEWLKCQVAIANSPELQKFNQLTEFAARHGLDLLILRHVFLVYSSPVLSIKQPWASAIIYSGKDCENRTWGVPYRGYLLIHASKSPDPDGDAFLKKIGVSPPAKQRTGGIVGFAFLENVTKGHDSLWAQHDGQFQWILRRPRPLPYLCVPGEKGLWKVPRETQLVPEPP